MSSNVRNSWLKSGKIYRKDLLWKKYKKMAIENLIIVPHSGEYFGEYKALWEMDIEESSFMFE